jgi:hypothetical protein
MQSKILNKNLLFRLTAMILEIWNKKMEKFNKLVQTETFLHNW